MGKTKYEKRWRHWVAQTRLPGIYKMKEGGHIARARVTDPSTGRMKELRKVLSSGSAHEAFAWLEAAKRKVREGVAPTKPQQVRFADYAVSAFERKVRKGELRSAASQSKWRDVLVHLIGGTSDDAGQPAVTGFGEFFVDQMRAAHVERWKDQMGALIQAGLYAPTTVNTWLAILRVVMKAAVREFELPKLATEGVTNFDTTAQVTYPEEAPNTLRPEQVSRFLATLKETFPQHYAMTFLGFATGLRPSSLSPLRHKGPEIDLLLDEGKLRVRRSHTRGDQVLNTTKQKTRYTIELPPGLVDVMRWHVATQLASPEQQESDLLFPSINGKFRAPTVLNKPFAEVSDAIGLGYHFTQRGMRRTFNDLMRAAGGPPIVTRSISGHATEEMQDHYSTVTGAEQRASISKIMGLMLPKEASGEAA